jgi:hypothetical protein
MKSVYCPAASTSGSQVADAPWFSRPWTYGPSSEMFVSLPTTAPPASASFVPSSVGRAAGSFFGLSSPFFGSSSPLPSGLGATDSESPPPTSPYSPSPLKSTAATMAITTVATTATAPSISPFRPPPRPRRGPSPGPPGGKDGGCGGGPP